MDIYEKYSTADVGTKEYFLFNLFSAYFNQDCEGFEETMTEYVKEHDEEAIMLTIEAINEFQNNSEFSKSQKNNFCADSSSYFCTPDEAEEWIENIKMFLKKCLD